MNTRTRQAVMESQVIATILSENSEKSFDIRCLCINERLAQFIIAERNTSLFRGGWIAHITGASQ